MTHEVSNLSIVTMLRYLFGFFNKSWSVSKIIQYFVNLHIQFQMKKLKKNELKWIQESMKYGLGGMDKVISKQPNILIEPKDKIIIIKKKKPEGGKK